MDDTLIQIAAGIGAALMLTSVIPDTVKAVKSAEIVGVTISSLAIQICSLVFLTITNLHYGNYPVIAGDVVYTVCIGIQLYFRKVKRVKEPQKCLRKSDSKNFEICKA